MFGMSGTELIIVLVVALLVLGPQKLPELARQLGKGLREFRKATEGIRNTVEQEFYKMDQQLDREVGVHDVPLQPPPIAPVPNPPSAAPTGSVALPSPAVAAPATSVTSIPVAEPSGEKK